MLRVGHRYLAILGVVVLVGSMPLSFSVRSAEGAGESTLTLSTQIACVSCTPADSTFADLFAITGTHNGVAFDSSDPDGASIFLFPGNALRAYVKNLDGTYGQIDAQTDTMFIPLSGILTADIVTGTIKDLPPFSPHLESHRPLLSVTSDMTSWCLNGLGQVQGSITSKMVIMYPFDESPPGFMHSMTGTCSVAGS